MPFPLLPSSRRLWPVLGWEVRGQRPAALGWREEDAGSCYGRAGPLPGGDRVNLRRADAHLSKQEWWPAAGHTHRHRLPPECLPQACPLRPQSSHLRRGLSLSALGRRPQTASPKLRVKAQVEREPCSR